MQSKSAEIEYRQYVEEFSDMVTRLCVLHTGNFTDAEDCYQNVFLKLYTQMCKGEIPNVKAWLIRVTLNECRSALRHSLWKSTVELDEVTAICEDKHEFELLDAVYKLPAKYRDVIYLYYYEELSIEEIAVSMKSNKNTVKSRLKRGREKLKDFLT